MQNPILFEAFTRQRSVCTDTRKIQSGDIFFALKGPNFNGNRFAAQALAAGAKYAVIDEAEFLPKGNPAYILVDDVLKALQDLAREYRKTFSIPFIGLTGSNGKTTTKELIASVLATEKKIHATQGNLNNHIGVPLTLLSMPEDIDLAVIEMGANKPGDIQELCEIALPTHGLITNIGQAHLELFGGLDGVQKTKGELFDHLRENQGTAWVNVGDERVEQAAAGLEPSISYGSDDAQYQLAAWTQDTKKSTLTISKGAATDFLVLEANLIGSHNMQNVLAAVVIADTMGISPAGIQQGIANYLPKNNRTEFTQHAGYTLMMDAYNANPSSMRAAIATVFSLEFKKVALVIGDMFELGEQSAALHREIGEFINQFEPHITIGLGKDMHHTIEAVNGKKVWYESVATADAIAEDLQGSDLILIKGSRGMALEKLLQKF